MQKHEYAIKVLNDRKNDIINTIEHIVLSGSIYSNQSNPDYFIAKKKLKQINEAIFILTSI